MTSNWQSLASDKKRRQHESIPTEWLVSVPPEDVLQVIGFPEECGLLSDQEVEITNTGVDRLLEMLATGEWSAVEVTTAFYKRAIIAQQVTNCLTEIFVEKALARAAELDEHLRTTGKLVGPMHGLPVSLKDQLSIKGLETTIGYVSWIGKYADRNAVLVDILHEAGAVPFVRTNVPQTLMFAETFNNIFGRTVNPFNRSLTSGGSSGGEGALIAMKGSPLGVGSDIGGSVRIPSGFCGLYGLRPSYGRVPYAGTVNSMEGQDSVSSVLGPMSASLSGIKVFMKSVIAQKPWLRDPLAARMKWDEDEYQLAEHGRGENMCFGIIWHDGIVVPHPPVTRALEITKNALIAAGHKVIDWQPLKHAEIRAVLGGIWHAGCDEDFKNDTAPTGEPILRPLLISAADEVLVDENSKLGSTAYQLWQLQKHKRDLRQQYLDHWESTVKTTGTGRPVDAIITPIAPYAAPPHGKNTHVSYTCVWNTLDYPAMTFPVSTVNSEVDCKQPPHAFLNKEDEKVYELYDPDTFKGAPIGLQLVGRTMEEEAVIGMTEIVDAAIKKLIGSKGALPDLKAPL